VTDPRKILASLCKLAWPLLILAMPQLVHGAEPSFEWTLDTCVSRKLSARQLEPLMALEGQTVQSSVPKSAGRHMQIHISCADSDGRRLIVTTQVTADVASRTIDLEDTADELRPRVVALAATELLRRITDLPRPSSEPRQPNAQLQLTPPALANSPSLPSEPSPSRWLSLRTTRGIGYGLVGASAALTIVALTLSTTLIAARNPSAETDSTGLQDMSELAVGIAAVTTTAGLATLGYYGYAASHEAGATRALPPTVAQLRIGRAALALTALGVATLVPATVTLALAAKGPTPENSSHTQQLYFTSAGLYAAATFTLLAAATMGSMWWSRHQPPLRLALRPTFYASGAGLGMSGRF
jgi:hypothetical protein